MLKVKNKFHVKGLKSKFYNYREFYLKRSLLFSLGFSVIVDVSFYEFQQCNFKSEKNNFN